MTNTSYKLTNYDIDLFDRMLLDKGIFLIVMIVYVVDYQ